MDRSQANEQWEQLRNLILEHIGPVDLLQPEPWAPAMTFTRDLALVVDDKVVPLRPLSQRGSFETPLLRRHLASSGISLALEEPVHFDGGNVIADSHGRLLIGVTTRDPSDELTAAVRCLESVVGRAAYSVPLAGGRFPHIDMGVCDLNGRGWLIYPGALAGFDVADSDWIDFLHGLPVLVAEPHDGERLACNLVVHGDLAIGPEISSQLRTKVEALGIDYIGTPLSDLRKAGGGAHCLTLELP